MAELRFRLLGPPALEFDDRPLRLEMRKALALLAYLSLSPQPPTRETLAAMFWPEYDQQHAMSNFRRNLSSLQKSLPGNLLTADRERVCLQRQEWLKVDVDEFRALLRQAYGLSDPAQVDSETYISTLEDAAAVYKGDFCEGFNLKDCPDFDEWQHLERESLRMEYGEMLQKLVGGYQIRGEWEKAIAHARSYLALDRLNEAAHRKLMVLYSLSGQKSAALRQFDECKQVLAQELDEDPEQETYNVYDEIRRGGQSSDRDSPEPRAARLTPQTPQVPILKTKLFKPKTPTSIVDRPHLMALLDEGIQYPLTVLSAPAGYGKTTTLAEWASHNPRPVAWVAVDPGDNDASRLISYMIHALQEGLADPTFGSKTLELLLSPAPLPVEMVLSPLVDDLLQLPAQVVLILDDYHTIKAPSAHSILQYLLDHQPEALRLVLSTRVDPPLPLARMRANHRLFEIRTGSLRFSLVEATVFLNQIMGLGLCEEDITILGRRTEGWIAGYKMVSLALQQPAYAVELKNKRQFIQALSGSQRFIFDYLVEEVLSNQPAFIRSFLMKISVLDRFCASLCEAVVGPLEHLSLPAGEKGELTEAPQSYQQILEYLDHANMFLVPLDEERYWYRYHHLFVDILQSRLLQTEGKPAIQELHRRASGWLERHNFLFDAIYHAFAAGDFDSTARLVETNYIDGWEWNRLANIGGWIEKLPKEVVLKRPRLCCYHAYVEMLKGKLDGLDECLDSAQAQLEGAGATEENEDTLAVLYLTRAYLTGLRGNWAHATEIARTRMPKNSRYRGAYLLLYGLACFLHGDLVSCRSAYLQLIYENVFLFPGSISLSHAYLARVNKLEGRLGEAEQVYANALTIIYERGWEQFYMPSLMEFGLADLLRERNETGKAWDFIKHGLEKTGSWFPADSLATGYTVFSRVLQLKGDYPAALSAIFEAEGKLKGQILLPHIQSELETCKVRAYLGLGNLELPGEWLRDHASILAASEDEEPSAAFQDENNRITALRILLAQRKYTPAAALAGRIKEFARSGRRFGRVIEIGALHALALQGEDCLDDALQALEESLVLAQPEGYARIYMDEGEEMRSLLYEGARRERWQALNLDSYVEKLVET